MADDCFWLAFDELVANSEIIIDRPKGTKHPRYDFIYEYDYGYLSNTTSSDGEGIDVWLGSLNEHRLIAAICTVDLIKRDSEIKLLIDCNEDEINAIYAWHNNSEHMKGLLIKRS